MKNLRHLVLSFISTALLAFGFVRTAEKMDPLTLGELRPIEKKAAAPGCITECDFAGEEA